MQLVAEGLGVSVRTVWRWVERARGTGQTAPSGRARFEVSDALRERLAFWRGNVRAVHRELVIAAGVGGPPAPSLPTLHRAIQRDVLPGDRAGLRGGELARRGYDVFLQRPATHRNEVWEGDHVEAPVEVDVEGRLLKPWVTWFIDVQTNAVMGTAVTPGPASRESILATLRTAISVQPPYGPPGGLPQEIRIDRGKDFLSKTVASVMAALAVRVDDLPGYMPHLKGSVESLNNAAQSMFFAGLPRYTHAQVLANRRPVDPNAPALTFEAFTRELLAWVAWWNGAGAGAGAGQHLMPALADRTPLQAWLGDPTPITEIPPEDLRLLMLEDDGRTRKITTKGVSWRARHYVGAWMTGQVGREVRIRHMPHHEHEVEVFDATTAQHLGAATLADQATPEQIGELYRSRETRRQQLRADLKAAERARRVRYAASTTAQPAQPLRAVTADEAASEQADLDAEQLHGRRRAKSSTSPRATTKTTKGGSNVVPLRAPALPIPASWVLPLDHPLRQAASQSTTQITGGAVPETTSGEQSEPLDG